MTGSDRTFSEEGRIALAVRLPREFRVRMRQMALARSLRVNDLYQEILTSVFDAPPPGEPYLRAPTASAPTATLWLTPDFAGRLRAWVQERDTSATNRVFTTLLERFGERELMASALV